MTCRRRALWLGLTVLLLAPVARAEVICSYTDEDGVLHVTNLQSDRRCRKVALGAGGSGVYRREPSAPPGQRVAMVARKSDAFTGHVREAAQKYQLPEALLLAVMAVESNFEPRAMSEKGAMGLMQLMPGTARELYVSDAWDPAQNIEGGARYLRILANQYSGDLIKVLAAYNAGPEAVRRAGEAVPAIPETQEYVQKVVALYKAFKAKR